jgi:hypothetical protein
MWRQFAILIGFFELILFLCVFLQPESLNNEKMVSTNLFDVFYFRVALSIAVGLQLLVCTRYVWQFWNRFQMLCALSFMGIFTALLGWILVVVYDPNAYAFGHGFGACVFVGGTCVYYACMMRLAFKTDSIRTVLLYDVIIIAIMALAFLMTLMYILLWFTDSNEAWMAENLGFIFMVLAFILFFFVHQFSPEFSRLQLVETPMQCSPLMQDSA